MAAKPIVKGTPLAAAIMPDPNGLDPVSVEGLAEPHYTIPAFSLDLSDAESQCGGARWGTPTRPTRWKR